MESFLTVIQGIDMVALFSVISSVVGTASLIAAVIPQAAPAIPFFTALRKVLDIVGANIINAKNQEKSSEKFPNNPSAAFDDHFNRVQSPAGEAAAEQPKRE